MSLLTRYNTRLKALYRLQGQAQRAIDNAADSKTRQQRIDELTALGLAIRIMRDEPEIAMRKINDPLTVPGDLGERVRAAHEALMAEQP